MSIRFNGTSTQFIVISAELDPKSSYTESPTVKESRRYLANAINKFRVALLPSRLSIRQVSKQWKKIYQNEVLPELYVHESNARIKQL